MFHLLDYYTVFEILKFLDIDSLIKLSIADTKFRETYKDYIYHRHALECKTIESLDYFIPDTVSIPSFSDCMPLQKLMNYIASNSNLCIAGGFPTYLYMGITPKSNSDIDIYVLCGNVHALKKDSMFKNNELCDIEQLLFFIKTNYTEPKYLRVGPAVFNITVQEFSHPIQIIVTTYKSLAQVLSSFDNSHNRCGIHMGRSYVGIDTELTHHTKTTYFYKTTKPVRYMKALELGFRVFGYSDSELSLITSKVLHIEPDSIETKLTNTAIDHILNHICLYVKPTDNWMTNYTDQKLPDSCYIPIKIDLANELTETVKNTYRNGIFHKNTHNAYSLNPQTILKSPHSYSLYVYKCLRYELEFTIIGTFDKSKGRWIKVEDLESIQKLHIVKNNLLEIFKTYYGEIPEKIKRCRCLTTWEEFIEYRKILKKPVQYDLENNVWTDNLWDNGWEYYDAIIIYENAAYIKAIKRNQVMFNLPSDTRAQFTLTTIPEINKSVSVGYWGSYDFKVTQIKNI
jgi:hypothetical protein